jgi:hypothetical protein
MERTTRIGELLVELGRLDRARLARAHVHQRSCGGSLGAALVALGLVGERELADVLGAHLGVPVIEIGERFIPPHVIAMVPAHVARELGVLPIARLSEGGPLVVAVEDPTDAGLLRALALATGMEVRTVLAGEGDLRRAVARHYGEAAAGPPGRAGPAH